MAWTEETIFQADDFADVRKLVAEYEFTLQGISIPVRARIYQWVAPAALAGSYTFKTSHYMHTPNEAAPYMTSARIAESVAEALHRATDSVTMFYRLAVKAGKQPHDSWLVPNEHF
jgi:hypothetical protein